MRRSTTIILSSLSLASIALSGCSGGYGGGSPGDGLPAPGALCINGEPTAIGVAGADSFDGYWIYANDKKTAQETEDAFMKPGEYMNMVSVSGSSFTMFSVHDSQGSKKPTASCVEALPFELERVSNTESHLKPSQVLIRKAQAERDDSGLRHFQERGPYRVRMTAGKLEIVGKDETKTEKTLSSYQRITSDKALRRLRIQQASIRKANEAQSLFFKQWKGRKLELVKRFYKSGDEKRVEYEVKDMKDMEEGKNSKDETFQYPDPKTIEVTGAGMMKVNGTHEVTYRLVQSEAGEVRIELRYFYEETRSIHIMRGMPKETSDGMVEFVDAYESTTADGKPVKYESGYIYKPL